MKIEILYPPYKESLELRASSMPELLKFKALPRVDDRIICDGVVWGVDSIFYEVNDKDEAEPKYIKVKFLQKLP